MISQEDWGGKTTPYLWYYNGRAFQLSSNNKYPLFLQHQAQESREAIQTTLLKAENSLLNYEMEINKDIKNLTIDEYILQNLKERINKEIAIEEVFLSKILKQKITIPRLKDDGSNRDTVTERLLAIMPKIDEVFGKSKIYQISSLLRSSSFREKVGGRISKISYTALGRGDKKIGKKQAEEVLGNLMTEVSSAIGQKKDFKNYKGGAAENAFMALVFGLTDEETEALRQEIGELTNDVMKAEIERTANKAFLYFGLETKSGKSRQRLSTSEKNIKDAYKRMTLGIQKMAKEQMENLQKKNQILQSAVQKLTKENLFPVEGSLTAARISESSSTNGWSTFVRLNLYIPQSLREGSKKSILTDYNSTKKSLWNLILEQLSITSSVESRLEKIYNKAFNRVFKGKEEKLTELISFGQGQMTGVLDELAAALELAMNENIQSVEMIGKQLLKDSQQGNVDLEIIVDGKKYGIQTKNYSTSGKKTLNLYENTSFMLTSKEAQRYIDENLLVTLKFLIYNFKAEKFFKMNTSKLEMEMQDALLIALPALIRQDFSGQILSEDLLTTNTLYILNGQYFLASYLLLLTYNKAKESLKIAFKNKTQKLVTFQGNLKAKDFSGYVPWNAQPEDYRGEKGGYRSIKYKGQWYPKNLESEQSQVRVRFKGIKVNLR